MTIKFKDILNEGKTQEFKSNGKKYEIMVDNSRFGKVYRLWKVEGIPSKDLEKKYNVNFKDGWRDIEKVHAQAEDIIIKRYF